MQVVGTLDDFMMQFLPAHPTFFEHHASSSFAEQLHARVIDYKHASFVARIHEYTALIIKCFESQIFRLEDKKKFYSLR